MKTQKEKKQRRKWTKAEKAIFIGCIIVFIISILSIIYNSRYDILMNYYEDYEPVPLNLTQEQKLEDFEYYYDTIVSSFPMLEEYKDTLGFDFESRKEYYAELVKETTSDYEFFAVMDAITNEFPSFHSGLVFPRFNQYRILGCYNMLPTLYNDTVYPTSLYWDELLESVYRERRETIGEVQYFGYRYIDGEYVAMLDMEQCSKGMKILEVNGTDIHEYIEKTTFSAYDKQYDVKNDKVYLEIFYTNNKVGIPVTLTLEDTEGNISYQETYCEEEKSATLYLAMIYNPELAAGVPGVGSQEVYSYLDQENNIGYIRINSFYMQWAQEIAERLQEFGDCDAIIVDLRENTGGIQMLTQEYIYPYLFTKEEAVTMRTRWYMLDSEANSRIKWEDRLRLFFKFKFKKADEEEISSDRAYEYLYSVRDYEYEGALEEAKNIYVLIGPKTGSAADGFAAALKKTSATLIGDNTGGEGLADSFACDYLPNSGLVFTYMFGKAFNEDGTDNSLYGTAPDIYSYITPAGYIKYEELMGEGIDAHTYENQLLWDNVLQETVRYIQEGTK